MRISNTNWNLYKTFKVVFETTNLQRASEILGISRAAVGQNIKELGHQLGITLFTPHRRGVTPTPKAFDLYPSIKAAVDAIINAENTLDAFNAKSEGIIKIAVPSTTAELYINGYLQKFRANYPNVRLELLRNDTDNADIIIDLSYFITNHDVTIIDLFDVQSTFAATKKFLDAHNLNHTITKDQLFALPIVVYAKTWNYLVKYNDIQKEPPVIRTNSTDMNFSIMKNSNAIGYLGYYHKEILRDPDVVEIEVAGLKTPSAKMVCAFSKKPTLATKAFIDGLV